jgi:hypothetical protein
MRKYSNVNPMNGPILLEKYVFFLFSVTRKFGLLLTRMIRLVVPSAAKTGLARFR